MSVTGGRIVFGFFAIVALILWVWRTFTKAIRVLHKEAADRLAAKEAALEVKPTDKVSVIQVLFRSERSSIYIRLFAAIAIYYIFWNFVANTLANLQPSCLLRPAHHRLYPPVLVWDCISLLYSS